MFENIIIARFKAHKKHGKKSLESGARWYMAVTPEDGGPYVPEWDNKQNRILVEEIGEISKAMNEYALGNLTYKEYEIELVSEITDSIAVLSAWLDKLSNITIEDRVEEFENIIGDSIENCL